MTLNLIPALKGHGRRRAVDEVERLREDNAKLLDRQLAADDFFAVLLHDVVTTNDGWQQEKERRELAEKALAQAEETIRLRDRTIADLQRRVDVGVKAEHVIAKTQEIDARDLQERFASGRVLSLPNSPLAATDPAHVPAWVTRD